MRRPVLLSIPVLVVLYAAHAAHGAPEIRQQGDGDTFVDETFGLTVHKPQRWSFVRPDDWVGDMASSAHLRSGSDFIAAQYAIEPIVALQAPPPPFRVYATTFSAYLIPSSEYRDVGVLDVLRGRVTGAGQRESKDFGMDVLPTEAEIGGLPAAYCRYRSAKKLRNRRAKIMTERWLVLRDGYAVEFVAISGQMESKRAREEIRQIVESVRLD